VHGSRVRKTDRQTDRITEADDCYTHATTVGVSNKSVHHRLGGVVASDKTPVRLPFLSPISKKNLRQVSHTKAVASVTCHQAV